jgi:hypothetical protein
VAERVTKVRAGCLVLDECRAWSFDRDPALEAVWAGPTKAPEGDSRLVRPRRSSGGLVVPA